MNKIIRKLIYKKYLKLPMILIFIMFFPLFTSASNVILNDVEVWKSQKTNIIKNIKEEIYLNEFKISAPLEEEIKSLKKIFNKKEFIEKIKDVYFNIDKYYTNTKILPKNTTLTTNLVIIPKKVFIHQLVPPVMGIVIENKSIIQMHREMFEIMWKSV